MKEKLVNYMGSTYTADEIASGVNDTIMQEEENSYNTLQPLIPVKRTRSPSEASPSKKTKAAITDGLGESSDAGVFYINSHFANGEDITEPSERSREESTTPSTTSTKSNAIANEVALVKGHPIPDKPRPNANSNKPEAHVGKPDVELLTIPCTYPKTGRRVELTFKCEKLGITDKSEVDWDDRAHIYAINQWRNQIYLRGGNKKREGIKYWHWDEGTWVELYLYELIALAKRCELTKMPSAKDGVALLNEFFQGTIMKGSGKAHEPREEASFASKFNRLDNTLRNELKVLLKENKAAGKKDAKAGEDRLIITDDIFEQFKTWKEVLTEGLEGENTVQNWTEFAELAKATGFSKPRSSTMLQDTHEQFSWMRSEYEQQGLTMFPDWTEEVESSGPRPARNGHTPVPLRQNVWNFAAINHRAQRNPSRWVAINHPGGEREEMEGE